jgi:hypothetical protein
MLFQHQVVAHLQAYTECSVKKFVPSELQGTTLLELGQYVTEHFVQLCFSKLHLRKMFLKTDYLSECKYTRALILLLLLSFDKNQSVQFQV